MNAQSNNPTEWSMGMIQVNSAEQSTESEYEYGVKH